MQSFAGRNLLFARYIYDMVRGNEIYYFDD